MGFFNDMSLLMKGVSPSTLEEAKRRKAEEEKAQKFILSVHTKKCIKVLSIICFIVFVGCLIVEIQEENVIRAIKYLVISGCCASSFVCTILKSKIADIINLIGIVVVFVLTFLF